jgi:hypothetical protein
MHKQIIKMENNNDAIKKSKNTIYLEEFCDKKNIELIGEYDKVRLTTMIHFKCKGCKHAIKKSFKYMTGNKQEQPCQFSGLCSRCIMLMCH